MFSVWPYFEWGLHSAFRYRKTGSLLHCLFTLTLAGGSFLLHCPVSHLNLTLSGILLYEARTFLSRRNRQRPSAVLTVSVYVCRKVLVKKKVPAYTQLFVLSDVKTASADKLPNDGILRDAF